VIEVTDWARDIIGRSQRAARRFDTGARIRLARTATGIEAVLATGPEEGDGSLQVDDVTVFVEAGLEGLLDVEEPHDRLVLRPAGSPPNHRGEH
jgi:hypothetical protein